MAARYLDDYRNRIQSGKNVELIINADKAAFVVAAKEGFQVLSNLVSNALKFTSREPFLFP